jgi:moderate conductance mechanosensitive channel
MRYQRGVSIPWSAAEISMQFAAETPKSAKPPKCYEDGTTLCAWVWDQTKIDWLAKLSSWDGVSKILTIILIAVVAAIVRWLVHRAISRVTEGNGDIKVPTILRPLRERAPEALQATGLLSERRRQRARTIGSVMRSISSVLIFGVAVMLMLDQVGINLAPLIASAGIAGIALGFGAQNLVRDFLSGVFMMLEDQYGVGDIVDLGDASGTVEAVGLRITTVRDAHGVVWYVRNGEVIRVGNKSQGWAVVNVDVPVPFGTDVDRAQQVMQDAANALASEDDWKADLLAPPESLGVEQITPTGMMLRTTVKTTSDAQWRVARELRARLTEAVDDAGITSGMVPPAPVPAPQSGANGGVAGPT